ncbi:TIGR04222 domain-containing membrane protein [Actinacidiphila sp. bgisy144]|uniref:TIGR04222 domain-containing membrane protein n=1 Tax=Actinacidiphila sp. bgisy144 TaxID=3413791 RepID=UPI003EC0B7ED
MQHQSWGLSGPQFLALYAVLAVVAVAAVPLLWSPLRTARAHTGRPVGTRSDVYTLALVSGGGKRVVDTAVQALLAAGQVRVSRDHRIRPVSGATAAEPVQQAVLSAITALDGADLHGVRARAGDSAAVRSVHDEAVGQGLVLGGRQRKRARRALLAPAAVLVLGVVRVVHGIAAGRPVILLCVELTALVAALVLLGARSPRLTAAGRQLRALAGGGPADLPSPLLFGNYGGGYPASTPAVVLGVAAFGAVGLADAELRTALYGSVSMSSSGGGSSCGGSSCGGGGCGGGGCGGCGG